MLNLIFMIVKIGFIWGLSSTKNIDTLFGDTQRKKQFENHGKQLSFFSTMAKFYWQIFSLVMLGTNSITKGNITPSQRRKNFLFLNHKSASLNYQSCWILYKYKLFLFPVAVNCLVRANRYWSKLKGLKHAFSQTQLTHFTFQNSRYYIWGSKNRH